MKDKILYLFIQKGILGIFAFACGVILCIVPHYEQTKLPSFLPAIVVFGTAALIGVILYSDRLKKKFEFSEKDKQEMNRIDSLILSKLGWIALIIAMLSVYGISLKDKGIYIQGVIILGIGIVCIAQFIGYYHKLK